MDPCVLFAGLSPVLRPMLSPLQVLTKYFIIECPQSNNRGVLLPALKKYQLPQATPKKNIHLQRVDIFSMQCITWEKRRH